MKDGKSMHYGLIAQEVKESLIKAGKNFEGNNTNEFNGYVYENSEEEFYGLRYTEFIGPMVQSIKDLSKENKELKDEVSDLKEKLAKLEELVLKKLNN